MPRKSKETTPASSKKKQSKRGSSTKRTPKVKEVPSEAPETPSTPVPPTPSTPVKAPSQNSQVIQPTQYTAPSHTANIAPPTVNTIQHTAAPSAKEPTKNAVYYDEISKMMYTFGDVRQPVTDSVVLVEQYVKDYLLELIEKAKEIVLKQQFDQEVNIFVRSDSDVDPLASTKKSSKIRVVIELDHLLFMFRHNKTRMAQISRSLRWKLLRKANRSSTSDDTTTTKNETDNKQSGSRKRKLDEDLQVLHNKFSRAVKRQKTDVASLLVDDLPDAESDELDLMKLNQREEEQIAREHSGAADKLTKGMSVEEYMEYAKCREASFTYHNVKKFKDWLGLNNRKKKKNTSEIRDEGKRVIVKLDDQLVEILGHVAWETVGQLTQAALIVKRDMNMSQYSRATNRVLDQVLSEYAVERNIGLATGVMDMSLRNAITYFPNKFFKMLDNNETKHYFQIQHVPHQARHPIEPVHLLEAARRLNAQKGSFIDFTYSQRSSFRLH